MGMGKMPWSSFMYGSSSSFFCGNEMSGQTLNFLEFWIMVNLSVEVYVFF